MTRTARLLLTLLATSPAGDLASDDLPCGSAIIADCAAGAAVVRRGAVAASSFPWVPVCCWVPTGRADEEILAALRELPRGTITVLQQPGGPDRESACIAALRRLPPPGPEEFAAWVASRLERPELAPTLAAAIAPKPGTHRSTLSRRLSPVSTFTARDWRKVYTLARAFAGPLVSAEDAARRAEVEDRRLRAWRTRYLDGPYSELRERFGWWWVAEVALREAGMVRVGARGRHPSVVPVRVA